LTVIRALAADGIDAKTDSLIRAAMEQAFNEKYDEALRTAEKMIAADPDGLLGYFAAASVRLGIMRLYRTRQFEDEFEELVNTAIKKGQKRSKKGGAWDYFFLGGAYGFRGAHKARELNWIGAFTDGWKGLQALDRALKYDPTLYDAYLGFGLYHYWRSALAGVLRAIPFVGDERQRGIEEMQLAIEKGRYSEVIATYALVEVYYNEKEYEKALELNRRLSEMYPGHIAWLYMEARILDAMQNWPEALQSTRRLIERINNSPYRTDGFLVEGYWLLTKAYIGLDQIEEARKACKTGLELADRRDASKELEAPWETYSEIRKRLKKLCRELSSE
jgi:tetratricopeptide (TPR) repeat protein